MKLNIPYYKTNMLIDIADRRIKAVLSQRERKRTAFKAQSDEEALLNPIDSPPLLKEIRFGNPNTNVKSS